MRASNRTETRSAPGYLVLFDLWAAAKVLADTFQEPFGDVGLRGRDLAALAMIEPHGPLTPTELASWTGMPAPTVTEFLRRLDARGYIARVPNPEDGRSYHVVITDEGREAHAHAMRSFVEGWTRIEAHLDMPVERVRTAIRALEDAVRSAAGLPSRPDPAELEADVVRALPYVGDELTDDEEAEVVTFIERLRRKR